MYSNDRKHKLWLLSVFVCILMFVINVFLFFNPPSNITQLKLNCFSPSILTVYTHNFLHSDLNHIKNNLTFYLLLLPFVFFFSWKLKMPDVCLSILLLNLLLLPLLQFPVVCLSKEKLLIGFSSIVSLVVLELFYLSTFLNLRVSYATYAFLFFILSSFTLIYIRYFDLWLTLLVLSLSLILCLAFFLFSLRNVPIEPFKILRKLWKDDKLSFIFLVLSIFILCLGLAAVFPKEVEKIGIYSHYSGIVIGSLLTLVYFSLRSNINKDYLH